MCSCTGFAKYTILLFNFIIVLAGIAIIATGAVTAKHDYADQTKGVSYFAIAVGVIIFFIAFLGCCGAIRENSCMLTTYAVILILLFILELTVGILAFVALKQDGQKLQDQVGKQVEDMMVNQTKSMDAIQEQLKCCGDKGPQDYTDRKMTIPTTCYDKEGKLYEDGCTSEIVKNLKPILKAVGGVAIAFGIIELVGAIFACMVRNRIGD